MLQSVWATMLPPLALVISSAKRASVVLGGHRPLLFTGPCCSQPPSGLKGQREAVIPEDERGQLCVLEAGPHPGRAQM